ncbi:hypothetical protein SDC9_131675 [bioreactor metagenome]|uniref:Protein TolB n=1 Tax=bioreactor metagenome TaxID=1076179 RepID=A0A645D7K6_9ZZZZ
MQISAVNAAQLKAVTVVPAANVQSLTWSSDSSVLGLVTANNDASGNYVYSATLLDGKTLNLLNIWAAADGMINAVAADGHTIALISSDQTTLTLFDLSNGTSRPLATITPGYLIASVSFSPDGKYFSLAHMDNWSVTIYAMDGSEVKTLTGFETAAPVYDGGYAGSSLAIVWHARATAQVQVVDSGTLGASTGSEDFLSTFTLSPDGNVLATSAGKTLSGNFTPAVTLWDAVSGTVLGDLVLDQTASGLSFSPDGSLLAVTVGNNVQVWDVASRTQLVSLSGHSDVAGQVAFSPDGKSLVSSGADNQLILWQVLP